MDVKTLQYYAYDISKEDIQMVADYFRLLKNKRKKFSGTATLLDISKEEKIKELPHADVAFLFKVTDVIEQGNGHKKTENVIAAIPAPFVVVSFPTVTMSGKPMNYPRRRWIELMCRRREYSFTLLEFSSELFYVIEK
jgi:hypothetical protein